MDSMSDEPDGEVITQAVATDNDDGLWEDTEPMSSNIPMSVEGDGSDNNWDFADLSEGED